MIPNHARFLEAIHERKKVSVRFYSPPDSGVVDRICAPLDYGPGGGFQDGLNRYWLWDYAGATNSHTLGLVPQQIVDLQVLGDVFDQAEFGAGPWQWAIPREWSSKAPVSVAPAAVSAPGQGPGPATADQGEASTSQAERGRPARANRDDGLETGSITDEAGNRKRPLAAGFVPALPNCAVEAAPRSVSQGTVADKTG